MFIGLLWGGMQFTKDSSHLIRTTNSDRQLVENYRVLRKEIKAESLIQVRKETASIITEILEKPDENSESGLEWSNSIRKWRGNQRSFPGVYCTWSSHARAAKVWRRPGSADGEYYCFGRWIEKEWTLQIRRRFQLSGVIGRNMLEAKTEHWCFSDLYHQIHHNNRGSSESYLHSAFSVILAAD